MIITKQQCIRQNTYLMKQNSKMINTIMIRINFSTPKSTRQTLDQAKILNVDQNDPSKNTINRFQYFYFNDKFQYFYFNDKFQYSVF